MNYLATFLIGITTFFGGIFHHTSVSSQYDGSNPIQTVNFGTTGYPAALDTTTNLPNPASTDSVATVSHSALHTNENLAIIATETKIGTGASTPTNNTILVGNGTGSSGYSASATSTNFLATNFTTSSSTIGSTSINTLLATRATTTDLYVGNLASTTNFRANVENIGNSTINALTVTTCTGCLSGATTPTRYTSTSTGAVFKTLNLSLGDMVCYQQFVNGAGTNKGTLGFRISSPWNTSSTTVMDGSAAADSNVPVGMGHCFESTTTETVTFFNTNGSAGAKVFEVDYYAGYGFTNWFN